MAIIYVKDGKRTRSWFDIVKNWYVFNFNLLYYNKYVSIENVKTYNSSRKFHLIYDLIRLTLTVLDLSLYWFFWLWLIWCQFFHLSIERIHSMDTKDKTLVSCATVFCHYSYMTDSKWQRKKWSTYMWRQ